MGYEPPSCAAWQCARPDGLPDLMLDSLDRGRVELRVRWDAGAKGKKSRRVPITPKLAAAIKRYDARHRDHAQVSTILVNDRGLSYTPWGIDQLMDRLERRVGFHLHAHAFRHTFATVACQSGWNLERLRSAMGHADYAVLHRYVRLSSERDLGPLTEWSGHVVTGGGEWLVGGSLPRVERGSTVSRTAKEPRSAP